MHQCGTIFKTCSWNKSTIDGGCASSEHPEDWVTFWLEEVSDSPGLFNAKVHFHLKRLWLACTMLAIKHNDCDILVG